MALPRPYRREDAQQWVGVSVPAGWTHDTEYAWAIREREGGPIVGAIGHRVDLQDVGYWLGAPLRRRGYMTEALSGVTGWLRMHGVVTVHWECVVGNLASAHVARAAGYRYTGTSPSSLIFHDGSRPLSWHGEYGAPHHDPLPWPLEPTA